MVDVSATSPSSEPFVTCETTRMLFAWDDKYNYCTVFIIVQLEA